MSVFDVLTTGSSPIKIYNASNVNRKLLGAFISVDVPPTSGSVVVDVQKNGTTIFSSGEKPFISSGSCTGSSYALDIENWDIGEYLSLIIDEVDGVASELVVQILYQVENITVDYTGVVLTGASFSVQEQDFFSIEGEVTTGSSPFLIYNTSGSTLDIEKVFGSVSTPSSGSSIVVDILKNGSSIFTSGSNMLQITSGSCTGETTSISETEWLPGEAITIDVKEAGDSTEDLVVQVIYSKNIESADTEGVTDHNDLTNIGVNTHDQIDTALTRLAGTSGSNTGDQDLSSYLTDANSDGKIYGRKDGEWAEVTSSGSGGGIEEAPVDGKQYVRQDGEWAVASGGSGASALSDLVDVAISGSPTEGQALAYNSGSEMWMPQTINSIYPAFTLPPALTDWTWRNQGTGVGQEVERKIYINTPAAASDGWRILERNIPASPYIITAALLLTLAGYNYSQAGIVLVESSSGKLVMFQCNSSGVQTGVSVAKFNSPTSWNATYISVASKPSAFGVLYLRIQDDNTNRICSFSFDGVNFIQVHSVSRTDYITPDKIGIGVDAANSSYSAGLALLSWKVE